MQQGEQEREEKEKRGKEKEAEVVREGPAQRRRCPLTLIATLRTELLWSLR